MLAEIPLSTYWFKKILFLGKESPLEHCKSTILHPEKHAIFHVFSLYFKLQNTLVFSKASIFFVVFYIYFYLYFYFFILKKTPFQFFLAQVFQWQI